MSKIATKPLDITWDYSKARSNFDKHGINFDQAATVLLDPLALTVFDAVHSGNEDRWFTLGISKYSKLLAVSHTYRYTDTGNIQVRIISARKATRRERKQYENTPR